MENLGVVSIIMPAYNSEKHIKNSIESVLAQSYEYWELLVVDDCSSDSTAEIVKTFSSSDSRIKYFRLDKNSGAAAARNKALEISSGRFVAYLDADDIWLPEKLEKQTAFMNKNKIGFSCSSYEVIDEDGKPKGKQVYMPESLSYKGFLKNNLLQTVGIMADVSVINKKDLIMPDIRRRQDQATWLQVLRSGFYCFGIKEILAQYRRTDNSLSSDKIKAVKGIWYVYRKVEHLPFLFSCFIFVRYAFLAVWKRIYFRSK